MPLPGSACWSAPCQPTAPIALAAAELFEHAGSGRLDSEHSQQIDWGNRCGAATGGPTCKLFSHVSVQLLPAVLDVCSELMTRVTQHSAITVPTRCLPCSAAFGEAALLAEGAPSGSWDSAGGRRLLSGSIPAEQQAQQAAQQVAVTLPQISPFQDVPSHPVGSPASP